MFDDYNLLFCCVYKLQHVLLESHSLLPHCVLIKRLRFSDTTSKSERPRQHHGQRLLVQSCVRLALRGSGALHVLCKTMRGK